MAKWNRPIGINKGQLFIGKDDPNIWYVITGFDSVGFHKDPGRPGRTNNWNVSYTTIECGVRTRGRGVCTMDEFLAMTRIPLSEEQGMYMMSLVDLK